MVNFLKKYSYDIVRMMVIQLGLMVFALAVSVPVSSNPGWFMLSSIFSVLFYLCILYTMCWDYGFSDKPRIDAGREKYNPWKYVKVSLCANSINILLGVIVFVTSFFITNTDSVIDNIYGVCYSIATFIQSMFAGINAYFFPALNSEGQVYTNTPEFLYLLFFVPSLIACGLGYFMGTRDKRIFFFIPRRKPKNM